MFIPLAARAEGLLCPALERKENYKNWQSYRYLVEGRDGWVFRTLADFKSVFKTNHKSDGQLQAFNNALKDRGVHLVIAMLPTRGMMHGDQIYRDDFNRLKAMEAYKALALHIRTLGLSVAEVDHFDIPGYFYKRDHHWTPVGALDMAGRVAAIAKESGDRLPYIKFTTEAQGTIEHKGTFTKVSEEVCKAPLPPEKTPKYITSGGPDDLLGDMPEPRAVLVGTSNSVNDAAHANFEGFLKQSLNADVLNFSVSGGGADEAMLKYLVSDNFRNHPPVLLIWEFPVYQDFDNSMFLDKAIAAARSLKR